MNVSFDSSFHKRLIKIKDRNVLEKVRQAIMLVEDVNDIHHIPHLKKLEGFKTFYRLRIGDYRIGLELIGDTLVFITIANRKDIYKIFP